MNKPPQLRLIKSSRRNKPEAGNLRHQVQEFLQIKKRTCRPTTIRTYGSVLGQYASFVGDTHWPPTYQGILNWFDHLDAAQVTETTVYSYWVHLRTFLNFLEKLEVLLPQHNPVRIIYKLEVAPDDPDLPPVSFPPEDTNALLSHLTELAQNDDREATRNLALIRLAYVTGVRETAIATLPLTNLNLRRRCVIIPAEYNKNKKDQEVYFDNQVKTDLQAWLAIRPQRDDVVNVFVSLRGQVGAAITPKGIYAMLQRVCGAAGIERRKFHALRHSSALDALDAGISIEKVQKQLGHASLTTTMKYLRGRDEDRRRAYQEYSLSDSLAERAAKRLVDLDLAG